MNIRWTALISAALLPFATVAAAAEQQATAQAPKVINKDAADTGGVVVAKAGEAVAAQSREAVAAQSRGAVVAKATEDAQPAEAAADKSVAAKPVGANTPDPTEKTVAKKLAPPPKPKPTVVISVDLAHQRMNVSEDGAGKYQWPISSGREGYYTPTGNFRPQWMAKMWRSRKYDDAPMPNSIFFTGGFAIHATFATGMLGRPASHGCVRLAPANAATLFKLVQSHGMERTKITVHGTPPRSAPAVARRDEPPRPRYTVPGYGPQRYAPPRYANGYGQPPRAMPAPQQKSLFVSIFGSNKPDPVVMQQRQLRARGQLQQRPLYVYTQDGRLVRVR